MYEDFRLWQSTCIWLMLNTTYSLYTLLLLSRVNYNQLFPYIDICFNFIIYILMVSLCIISTDNFKSLYHYTVDLG